jgi:ABC-type nitrate/sulfonate/bicarbonate transport system substrate-binding protein
VTPLFERKVDAVMSLEPWTTAALATETVKSIVNSVDAAPRHPWYLVVARADFLKQQREAVVRTVRAHVEAVKLLNTGPGESADIIARAFKLTAVTGASGKVTSPAEIVRQARERVGFDYEVTDREMEFFERQVAWAKSLGYTKGTHKAGEMFDSTVMRDALSGR